MSIGPPPKPAKLGVMVSTYAIQSCNEPTKAPDGTFSQVTMATVPNIPCNIQQMSSSEALHYQKASALGLFNLYIPVRLEGAATDLSVVIEDSFAVDGVVYAVIGTPIKQGNSGKMLVPTERQAV